MDLGWNTRYSDFANSEYWPNNDDKFKSSPLKKYLEEQKQTNAWFDIENSLLEDAREGGLLSSGNYRIMSNFKTPYNDDFSFFEELCKGLINYIKKEQSRPINKQSVATNILKIVLSYRKTIMYSFNYTNLNRIYKTLNMTQFGNISCNYMHGKVEDNSIIIGVDETKLVKGYELFHKTRSPYYHSHHIYEDLSDADEVIFFGLSFGKIDYTYFDRFFQTQANREHNDKHRKCITIFTYDEQARLDIIERLSNMDINIQDLYAQSDLTIIKTQDKQVFNDVYTFQERLEKNSKSQYNFSI